MKTLQEDVNSVLEYRNWIDIKTNNHYDSSRILGINPAARGAENYLPYTIPKIIAQISEMKLSADILIGLNDGFECPLLDQRFRAHPEVSLVHLYTEAKTENTIPARVFTNSLCTDEPYVLSNCTNDHNHGSSKHRVFIIHQRQGCQAPGKIRILGDMYALLLKSIEFGWIPPKIALTFDAESQILVNQQGSLPKIDSNGLKVMVEQLQSHLDIDILGANNRYVVFRDAKVAGAPVLEPDFLAEMPPIQWFLNILHGKYLGYRYLPGGCTIGKSNLIISIFNLIAKKYPGARTEDVQLSVLSEAAGFRSEICMEAVAINRVPALRERGSYNLQNPLWITQTYRWCTGIYALEKLYGKQHVQPICSGGFPWNVLFDPIGFLIRLSQFEKLNLSTLPKQIRNLVIALFTYLTILRKGLKEPDILTGSEAKASW